MKKKLTKKQIEIFILSRMSPTYRNQERVIKLLISSLESAYKHCLYSGDGHYELGGSIRQTLSEVKHETK